MQNRDAAIAHFSESLFKLSPEEIEELEQNTVAAIPKLLAKVLYEGQRATLQQFSRLIPSMVERHGAAVRANGEAEDQFFGMWPQLNKTAHVHLVRQYGAAYRSMHPGATRDQMFKALGPIIMMVAGVTPGPGAAPKPPQQSRPQPFVPAGGGGAPAVSTPVELSPVEAIFAHQD